MFCPKCACELPAVAQFCVRCGSRVLFTPSVQASNTQAVSIPTTLPSPLQSCRNCGARSPSNDLFCADCGTPLNPGGRTVFVSSTTTAIATTPAPLKEELPAEAEHVVSRPEQIDTKFTSEIATASPRSPESISVLCCVNCGKAHDLPAKFCKYCGQQIHASGNRQKRTVYNAQCDEPGSTPRSQPFQNSKCDLLRYGRAIHLGSFR